MLSVSTVVNKPYNFKNNDRIFVVKVGKEIMDSEDYVKETDCAIFSQSTKNPKIVIGRTCNFARVQLNDFKYKAEQNIYANVIKKCFNDIDEAILNGASQSKIDKLTETLELFIKKYGHLAK